MENNFSKPNKWEYVVIAVAIVSLLVSCIIVFSKNFFWNDELYSYYLLADQSFTHMLVAFHDKINNTPSLYFLLGWLWAKIFGATELSLRLFSCLGMCIALTTVWLTLRRTYNFWSTSIGILSIFCTSGIILSQNAEARMYGLFLAVCSLGLFQFDLNNRLKKYSINIIFANFIIHAAIVHTHLFGLFYSGEIIFSQILRDRYFKVFKPRIYLAIVLSWLSLILYIPSFLNQADAGNPRTWVPIPSLKDLIDLVSLSSSSFLKVFVLVLLILFSGLQFILGTVDEPRSSQGFKQNPENFNEEISLLIFAYAFLAVPVFVWIISRTVKPIFLDRYLIPSTLSWSILLAYLSSGIIFIPSFNTSNKFKIGSFITNYSLLLIILSSVLLINPISYAKNFPTQKNPGLGDNKYGYKDLPIVVQSSHQFLIRLHYSHERNNYFFILDWQSALDNASGAFGPQEYKHLEALKRNYPELFQNNIVKSEKFLNMHSRFLVVDDLDYDKKCPLELKGMEWKNIHCPRWLEMKIMSNPHYKMTPLGDIDDGKLKILLVESK